jgi:hypothetical protein
MIPTTTPRVWRFEYRTDLVNTRSGAIPLAAMLEVECEGMRYVGMLYRDELKADELAEINLETWPEMRDPKAFLTSLLEPVLHDGPDNIARMYSVYSALQMVRDADLPGVCDVLGTLDNLEGASHALEGLLRGSYEDWLEPPELVEEPPKKISVSRSGRGRYVSPGGNLRGRLDFNVVRGHALHAA